MDVVAYHKSVREKFDSLPKKQRTPKSVALFNKIEALMEDIANKKIGLQVQCCEIKLSDESGDDLSDIAQRYETLLRTMEQAVVEDPKKDSECVKEKARPHGEGDSKRGEDENDDSASACACREPAPSTDVGEYEESWERVQDNNEEVAALRRSMAATIKELRVENSKLREQLETQSAETEKLRAELKKQGEEYRAELKKQGEEYRAELEKARRRVSRRAEKARRRTEALRAELHGLTSRVYMGEVVARLNDYLKANGGPNIQNLMESHAQDENEKVQMIVNAAQTEFKDTKKYPTPLAAFQVIANGVRISRNGVAHPEQVHVDTIRNTAQCVPEQKLINVLLAVAEDQHYPLRKIDEAADKDAF